MAEENSLFDLLDFINSIKAKRPNINNYRDLELSNNEKYLFKPLEDIPAKKGNKEEKRNGFLVYSLETIKTKLINRSETLEQRFQCVYEKCNDYKKIKDNENYIYRYYYYQELEYKNNEKPSNFDKNRKLATIIMINPAFASSRDNDSTINNITSFLESLKFKSFEIVNLYPIRLPKPDCLDCFNSYLNFNKDNYHNFLMQYLQQKNNGELIAAWGKEYNIKAKAIFENLKNKNIKFKAYQTTKGGEPIHFAVYNKYKNNINNLIKDNKYQMTEIDV